VIADTRKILYTTTADHDDGVLLEIMALAGNVSGDFGAIGEADSGKLTKSRVWLLWGHGSDFDTNTALERRGRNNGFVEYRVEIVAEGGRFGLYDFARAAFLN